MPTTTTPDFIVIGSSRSGTTTVRHCLRRHPNVYVPERVEPRFFAFEDDPMAYCGPGDDLLAKRVVTSWRAFSDLYRAGLGAAATGDISPAYLSSPCAPSSIQRHCPSARIVAILRNPIERAVSSFRLQRLDGFEPVSDLHEALSLETSRRSAGWSYVWNYLERGHYHPHLLRYFELFDRARIKVFLYDDWHVRSGASLLADLLEFLELAPCDAVTKDIPRLNSTSRDRFTRAGVEWYEPREPTIELLRRAYSPRIAKLEDLIGRDLTGWNI